MQTIETSKLLKFAFLADAVACGTTAALQLVGGQGLAVQLALPAQLLTGTGVFLALNSALLIVLAQFRTVWTPMAWIIILGNVGWAAITLDLVLMGTLKPSTLGVAFLTVQSLAVLALGALQYAGLKRSPIIAANRSAHAMSS